MIDYPATSTKYALLIEGVFSSGSMRPLQDSNLYRRLRPAPELAALARCGMVRPLAYVQRLATARGLAGKSGKRPTL